MSENNITMYICVCVYIYTHIYEVKISVVSDSWLHGLYSLWNSLGQNPGVGGHSLLQGIFPTQGWNTGLPHFRQDSLPSEPSGKPKNTGMGSLSLLQVTFPSQELNRSLQLCRQILYQLSYHGSLYIEISHIFFIYSSVGGHFHVLAIIYNAAMIIGMHIPY